MVYNSGEIITQNIRFSLGVKVGELIAVLQQMKSETVLERVELTSPVSDKVWTLYFNDTSQKRF